MEFSQVILSTLLVLEVFCWFFCVLFLVFLFSLGKHCEFFKNKFGKSKAQMLCGQFIVHSVLFMLGSQNYPVTVSLQYFLDE